MCKTYVRFGEWVRTEHTVYSCNKTSDSIRAHLSFLPHEEDFLVPGKGNLFWLLFLCYPGSAQMSGSLSEKVRFQYFLYYCISSNQLLHLFLVITFLLCLNTRSFKATEKFLLALKKCLQFEYTCKSSKHLKKRLDTMSGVEGRGLFLNTASDVRSVS